MEFIKQALLKKLIKEKYGSISNFCVALNMSQNSFFYKLSDETKKNQRQLKLTEVQRITKLLQLSDEQFVFFFKE